MRIYSVIYEPEVGQTFDSFFQDLIEMRKERNTYAVKGAFNETILAVEPADTVSSLWTKYLNKRAR